MNDCPRCKRLACVCDVTSAHLITCPYRTAVTCAVAIECPHGFDACPKCDPCTCLRVMQRALVPRSA